MGIVIEEADETVYWMELLLESGKMKEEQLNLVLKEANELLSISIASVKTAKRGKE